MKRWHNHAREQAALLRLLVRYFEVTSRQAADPRSHTELLAAFRSQLAQLEEAEAARVVRFRPVRKLMSFVFGRLRAI